MTARRTKKWESITRSVRSWAFKHQCSEKEDQDEFSWTLKWGSTPIDIHRKVEDGFTIITSSYGITGDDLAYYQSIGGNDWRFALRLANAQLCRTELSFLNEPTPGFILFDYLFDDAFTKDELFRRVRNVALTELFLISSIKIGKAKLGMRGAEPKAPSDTYKAMNDEDDLKLDRLQSKISGGSIGSHHFKTTDAFIGSIILSIMAELETDYGTILDTQLVIDQVIEGFKLPLTLILETIDYLKRIGFLFEVEPERIQRVD